MNNLFTSASFALNTIIPLTLVEIQHMQLSRIVLLRSNIFGTGGKRVLVPTPKNISFLNTNHMYSTPIVYFGLNIRCPALDTFGQLGDIIEYQVASCGVWTYIQLSSDLLTPFSRHLCLGGLIKYHQYNMLTLASIYMESPIPIPMEYI